VVKLQVRPVPARTPADGWRPVGEAPLHRRRRPDADGRRVARARLGVAGKCTAV